MKEIDQALLKKVIIERSRSSHKGDYGRLLLIGGTVSLWGSDYYGCLSGRSEVAQAW